MRLAQILLIFFLRNCNKVAEELYLLTCCIQITLKNALNMLANFHINIIVFPAMDT